MELINPDGGKSVGAVVMLRIPTKHRSVVVVGVVAACPIENLEMKVKPPSPAALPLQYWRVALLIPQTEEVAAIALKFTLLVLVTMFVLAQAPAVVVPVPVKTIPVAVIEVLFIMGANHDTAFLPSKGCTEVSRPD